MVVLRSILREGLVNTLRYYNTLDFNFWNESISTKLTKFFVYVIINIPKGFLLVNNLGKIYGKTGESKKSGRMIYSTHL